MEMPIHYLADNAPKTIQDVAGKYEARFGIKFHSLTYFSESLLDKLFSVEKDISYIPATVASRDDKAILADIETLTRIANTSNLSLDDRKKYFSTLKAIYGKLPSPPDSECNNEGTLFVAPEREGRILAEAMNWLPSGHSLHPHAKRMSYEGGLLVGLDKCEAQSTYSNSIIVDGAIASGVTIMAVMTALQSDVRSFQIYTVHSTCEGLRAIVRYGELLGLHIGITAGHATSGMNGKFYATVPGDPSKLMVGDLGDTISFLED